MITEETEEELRRSFARAAAEFDDPGRARQRVLQRSYHPGRPSRRMAVGAAAVSGAVAAAALAVSGVLAPGSGPAHASRPGTAAPAPARGGHIGLAAFSILTSPNGTVTVIANPRRMFDPGALQRALARHGIPAVVSVGRECYSTPAPDSDNVFPGNGRALVINPAALPAGTEIGFGYFAAHQLIVGDVMDTKAHTCTADLSKAGSSLLIQAWWSHHDH